MSLHTGPLASGEAQSGAKGSGEAGVRAGQNQHEYIEKRTIGTRWYLTTPYVAYGTLV